MQGAIRRLLGWLLVAVTTGLFAGCTPGVEGTPRATQAEEGIATGRFSGYNVVLVSFDAVRADHVGCYGYDRPTTPNLDKLAAESYRFERTVAASSWTVPSTMSIFTGLWPAVHQVLNKYTVAGPQTMVPTRLNPAIPTIPEHLGRKGYELAAFTGDAGAKGSFGFDRGFDVYLDDRKFGGFDYSVPAAQQWLREHSEDRFFMFLHGYDAHGQYDPPDGYRQVFAKDYAGTMKGGRVEQGELREQGLRNKFEGDGRGEAYLEISEEDFEFHAALYDEKIQDADARFAEFLTTLEELGLRDKTILVVTSDHGEEFGDHGYLDHGPTLYDELVRVPFVLHLPGEPGGVISQQVRILDILPTVADLLGIELPFVLHGVSLLPLLAGQQLALPAFAETDYRLFTHKRALIDAEARYKFVLTLESGRRELYDLREDPAELRDIVEEQPRVAYEMEQELVRWMLSMNQDPASFENRREEMIKEY